MEGVLEEADEQQDDTLPETPSDAATSRRARLAALSNRMKKEFGHSSDITLDGENWLKNLHPWHKRILFKPESPNESPSESSNGSGSPSRLPNNADHNIESTPSTSKFESPQMIESVSRRARLAALTNRMRKEFDNVPEAPTDENDSMTRSLQPFYRRASSRPETPEPSKASQEMINPPPSEPPPPLPAMELRSPPPLPPRNPSIQLPMPSPIEQLTSEKASEASTASGSRQTSINSAESVNTKNEDNSCAKTEEIVQRKRGHMKTLSLDRDFNFAKSLRSSPFPPTSNKSNSLTRQAGAEQEEELRIIEAEGVINEITSDLQISEKEILNSAIPCPLNYVAANGCNILEKPKTILEKVDEGKTPESDLESPVKKIELNVESSASLPITDHLLTLSSSPKAPLDPISRDVERRLSMKFDRSLIKELPDDSLSGHSSIRSSSIDHAKVLARTASNYASSIFRGAINKVKQVAHTGSHSSNENDDETTDSDGDHSEAGSTTTNAVVRPRKTKKGPFDFQHLKIVQEINNEHSGPVWCIKFSACGRLLATAGADCVLRVWCLTTHVQHFQGMRERYQHKMDYDAEFSKKEQWETFEAPSSSSNNPDGVDPDPMPIFASKPFASYKGHVADILDLSWSKNYFILSSGMDRTAKLWHISRNECLCCFQHQDFVTSVSFLPKDDRYFVSGSLDGRMRIWNIPEKKVVFWNEVEEKLITALTFVKNGKFIVVGTYYGKCYFYTSELKYHTVISTRGRSSMGNKVTGLSVHGDKLLVTFNDSRIHMYDIRDKVLICKFRGAQHERSQIRASFSPDGRHVVSGSEDKFIYLWRTSDAQATRRDRNTMWERVRAHKTTVTVALFAPDPQLFLSNTEKRKGPQPNTNVIASADLDGSIKVMLNRATPKETLTNLPLEPVPEVDAPLTDNRANSLPKVNF